MGKKKRVYCVDEERVKHIETLIKGTSGMAIDLGTLKERAFKEGRDPLGDSQIKTIVEVLSKSCSLLHSLILTSKSFDVEFEEGECEVSTKAKILIGLVEKYNDKVQGQDGEEVENGEKHWGEEQM